jgi:hypothetical protein
MVSRSPFTLLGITLLVVGLLLTLTSYLILRYVPFTALGASTLILAAVSLALGRGQPKIPPETSSMLLDSGLENTAALIEELGLQSKAIYLPSSIAGGTPHALLPLSPEERPILERPLSNRLVVRYGPKPNEMGILISTLGSIVVKRFGPITPGSDLEGAISSILAGSADLADGLSVVENGNSITVEVTNPRIGHENLKLFDNIGSPLASIIASAAADAKNRSVEIMLEGQVGSKYLVELNLLGRSP